MTILSCPLAQTTQLHPDSIAIVRPHIQLTYKQFDHAVNGAVNYLGQNNINANESIAILSNNPLDTIILQWALWRLKAIVIPLSCDLPEQTIHDRLHFLNTKKILTSHFDFTLESAIPVLSCQNVHEFSQQLELDIFNQDKTVIPQWPANQPATLIFTSGSSAEPKAALLSLGNQYFNALGSNEHIPLHRNDRWLLSLPLHHVSGQAILMRCVMAGSTIFIPEPNKSLSDTITELSITHLSAVPTQLARILEESSANNLECLKACLIGGSGVDTPLIKKALEWNLPIYTSYGLTEMGSQVATTAKLTQNVLDQGAQTLPSREIKISGDGEICVKGKCLFLGYMNTEGLNNPRDAEGWFATGDLGKINSKGFLKVSGRKDNMFISGGENIQPEEIEKYLLEMREIHQALVIPQKEPTFGYQPIAFINFISGKSLSRSKIQNYLSKHVQKFKIPHHFYCFSDEGNQGLKTSRFQLAKNFAEGQSESLFTNPFQEIL